MTHPKLIALCLLLLSLALLVLRAPAAFAMCAAVDCLLERARQ